MFSHSFKIAISRLLLCNFFSLNLHSIAFALRELELRIVPRFAPLPEDDLKSFQGPKGTDIPDLWTKLQLSWDISISKDGKAVQTVTFSPYQKLREFLQSKPSVQQSLQDLCETVQSYRQGGNSTLKRRN